MEQASQSSEGKRPYHSRVRQRQAEETRCNQVMDEAALKSDARSRLSVDGGYTLCGTILILLLLLIKEKVSHKRRDTKLITSNMQSNLEPAEGIPAFFKAQRIFIAICMFLPPLLLILELSTAGILNPANGHEAIANFATISSPIGLHFALVIIASLLFVFGFLGMAWLAMSRSPWLASIGGALSLMGTMTFAVFIAQDDMTYDMAQLGSSTSYVALWDRFNGDIVMTVYLVLFIVGIVLGPLLLGIALGRARVIPLWAASVLVLSRLILIIAFPAHIDSRYVDPISYALLFLGSIPAALAMLRFRKKEASVPMSL